jgi:hypothetical protein
VPIEIPAALDTFLCVAARQEYQNLDVAPLGRCIDASGYHFTIAKEYSQSATALESPEACIVHVLISCWILNKVIKPGQAYLQGCSETPKSDYDRQLNALGLSVVGFVQKLEEVMIKIQSF